MANATALRTVLSKHTVKRLRELVRTRINLSGYSKMVKQDLISAILNALADAVRTAYCSSKLDRTEQEKVKKHV